MISFNPITKFLLPAVFVISALSACGGGASGGSDTSNGGFTTSNTNTKPQVSSSSAESSTAVSTASSVSTSHATESSKSAAQTSSSKSSQSKSSTSSKAASSAKSTTNGIDSTAPAIPSNFVVVSSFSDVIFLSWAKSTDNVAVVAYKVYRDGIQIADIAENENYYADYNVATNKTYIYGLSAGDAAGNWSEITTLSATASPTSQTSSKASSSSSKTNSSGSSSSSKASSISSKASSSSSSAPVVIGVSFQWQRPTFRENGSDLFEHEIARYELRYTLPNSIVPTNVIIMSPLLSKTLLDIPSNAAFEIATVDTNGLYSQFIPIRPL